MIKSHAQIGKLSRQTDRVNDHCFLNRASIYNLFQPIYVPAPKVRGGHIGLSADPVGVGARFGVGVTNSCNHDIS